MKKLLTLMAAMLLAAALSVSASAAESPEEALEAMPEGLSTDEKVEIIRETYVEAGYTDISEDPAVSAQSEEVPEEVRQLAYMDLEGADEETQAQILEARKTVIYTRSWRADDVIIMSANPETRTLDIVPKFSDVFPGWDLPVEDVEDAPEPAESQATLARGGTRTDVVYNTDYYVPKSKVGVLAPNMCTVTMVSGGTNTLVTGSGDEYFLETLSSVNIGYTDVATGKSLGFVMHAITQRWEHPVSIEVNPAQVKRVGVRVSTNDDISAYEHFEVKHSFPWDYSLYQEGSAYAKLHQDEREALRAQTQREIQENNVRHEYEAMGYVEKPADVSPAKEIPEDVLKTAKLDISNASEALKQKVLSARRRVVYSYSGWSADDVLCYWTNKTKGEEKTFTIQPKFHDLFPADWDLPIG